MKQKTNRAANKRFSVSARGKVKKLPIHQSHFNAKDNGDETRRKHSPSLVSKSDKHHLKRLLPYQ